MTTLRKPTTLTGIFFNTDELTDEQRFEKLKNFGSGTGIRMRWSDYQLKLDELLGKQEFNKKYEYLDKLLASAVNHAVPRIVAGLLVYGADPSTFASTPKNAKAISKIVMQFFQYDFPEEKKAEGSKLQLETLKLMLLSGADVKNALYGGKNLLKQLYEYYGSYTNETGLKEVMQKWVALLLVVLPRDIIKWEADEEGQWAKSLLSHLITTEELEGYIGKGLNNKPAQEFLDKTMGINLSQHKGWLDKVTEASNQRKNELAVSQQNSLSF